MRKFSLIVFALLLSLAACKDKPREVSKAARMEAANLSSEAAFALGIREWSRAEDLLARAVELDPEDPTLWLQLGVSRRQQDNRGGAKKAYKKALSLQEEAVKRDPKNPSLLMDQIDTLVLLGRSDDARKVLEKAARDFPDNEAIKGFIAEKVLDKMLENPEIKKIML